MSLVTRACVLVTALASMCATVLGFATPAGAESSTDPVTVEATVDGRAAGGASSNDPLEVDPLEEIEVELLVTNNTDEEILIGRARFFGEAFGLTFIAYDVMLERAVAPGRSERIDYTVQFIDLEKQATGLLPGGFSVYDDNRTMLAEQEFVIDVRGSALSVVGVFAFLVALATALGVIGVIVALQRGTLSPNRAQRAVRFASIGLGAGLTFVTGLSVFRILAPTPAVWIPLTIIPIVVGAVVGYVSPGPLRIEEVDEHAEIEDAGIEDDHGEDASDGSIEPPAFAGP